MMGRLICMLLCKHKPFQLPRVHLVCAGQFCGYVFPYICTRCWQPVHRN